MEERVTNLLTNYYHASAMSIDMESQNLLVGLYLIKVGSSSKKSRKEQTHGVPMPK